MQLLEVTGDDDEAVAAWHAAYLASALHGRTHPTPWMLPEIRAKLRGPRPGDRRWLLGGSVDGEVVTAGYLELPLLDNTGFAWIAVDTHPAHRRRGHGSAMLEELLGRARQAGRTVVGAEAAYPFDGPADGAGHPSVEFLRRRGFTFALGDVQRVLDLPVEDRLLADLAAEVAPHHTAYTLRHFRGLVPEDLLDSYGQLVGQLVVEAPMGELELEPEVWTPERIRAQEEIAAASGRTRYTTVAQAPDGECVAYTELVVPRHDPGRVYQWGTLVAPGHRGHRLGLAVKVHNLRWLQQERGDLRFVTTFNAEVNGPMVEVNERMGFRPVERSGEFKRQL